MENNYKFRSQIHGITRRDLVRTALPFALASGLGFPKFASGAGIVPVRASVDAFLDSIGVCTHFANARSIYGTSFDEIFAMLKELGVRHLRDEAIVTAKTNEKKSASFKRFRRCVADGMRFDMICYDRLNRYVFTPAEKLEEIFDWCDGGIEMFEGSNEPNLTGSPAHNLQVSVEHQRALYEMIKGSAKLRHIPLSGPSYVQGSVPLADNISDICDYGNIHPYAGMEHPETTGNGSLSRIRNASTHIFGNLPYVATEMGYHTALATTQYHFPVTEGIKTRYLPRMLLWAFVNGLVRTYIYELVSSFNRGRGDPESSFGLINNDLSRTSAFAAIKAMLALCRTSGMPSPPGNTSLVVKFNGVDAERLHMLLDRSDGSLLVPVWLGVRGWRWPQAEEAEPQERLTNFYIEGSHTGVFTHRFLDDGRVRKSLIQPQNGTYELPVSDQLTFIEIMPNDGK